MTNMSKSMLATAFMACGIALLSPQSAYAASVKMPFPSNECNEGNVGQTVEVSGGIRYICEYTNPTYRIHSWRALNIESTKLGKEWLRNPSGGIVSEVGSAIE